MGRRSIEYASSNPFWLFLKNMWDNVFEDGFDFSICFAVFDELLSCDVDKLLVLLC